MRTSVRVHFTGAVPLHAQPCPLAEVAERPDGILSATVTVLPSVRSLLWFATDRVSVFPFCPWTNWDGLWLAEIWRGEGMRTHGSGI